MGENGIRVWVEGRLAAHSDELLMSSTCRHQLNQLQHQAFALPTPPAPDTYYHRGLRKALCHIDTDFLLRIGWSLHTQTTPGIQNVLSFLFLFPHFGRGGGFVGRLWRCSPHSAVGLLKMSSPSAYRGHVRSTNRLFLRMIDAMISNLPSFSGRRWHIRLAPAPLDMIRHEMALGLRHRKTTRHE
jgi:hypothetical protein